MEKLFNSLPQLFTSTLHLNSLPQLFTSTFYLNSLPQLFTSTLFLNSFPQLFSSVKFDRRPSEAAVFGPRCRGVGHSKLINSRYGLRGVRVGEASNPGPARQRGPEEILNELEATLTRLDSSDEEPLLRPVSGRNVVRRVSDAVERSIGDPVQVSRRVVLAPQSPGTPRSVQNCASNRFSILAADSTFEDCSVSQTIPATPHALDEAGVLGPSATLLDDLECDLTRVDTDQVRVESRQRVPCRPTVCAMSQGSGSDTESSDGHCAPTHPETPRVGVIKRGSSPRCTEGG